MKTPQNRGDVTLYNKDCLEVLRGLPDRSTSHVQLVLTDPPYNVNYSYNSTDDNRSDYAQWCAKWLTECERISTGPVCFTPGIVNLSMWYGIKPPWWVMCWWKPAAMGRSPLGFNNWEPILMYGQKPTKEFRNKTDVIRGVVTTRNDLNWHPCPKPLEWAVKLVKHFTKVGDTVLDPFMGSGTVGVACRQTGRKFIGIEHDQTYFEKASVRIKNSFRKATFFE